MATNTFPESERRDSARRLADRAVNELMLSVSANYCYSCLESMDEAILLLDSGRKVLYRTSQVDQILERSTLPVTLSPKFTLPLSPHSVRLSDFLSEKNTKPGPLVLCLAGKECQHKLLLTCHRLSAPLNSGFYTAKYLIKLHDPSRCPIQQWHFFTEQFNLTQAEARISRALADGLTLKEYCADWHVKISTARSQLSSVLSKTAAHGQSDLLRLIYLFTQH